MTTTTLATRAPARPRAPLARRLTRALPAGLALAGAALLPALLPAPAGAQERAPADAEVPEAVPVERVYLPEAAFDRVLKRHPRGVVVTPAELEALLEAAGARPAPAPLAPPPPVAATIRSAGVAGSVQAEPGGDVAALEVDVEVTVLAEGTTAVPVPLQGVGVRRVLVDGAPARVVRTAEGPAVLLDGPAPTRAGQPAGAPVTRRVRWEVLVRVEPGEERGAGQVTLPVPAAAAGRLTLTVPGEVEVVLADAAAAAPQMQLARGRAQLDDRSTQGSRGVVAWVEAQGPAGAGRPEVTQLAGSFGGGSDAGAGGQVVLAWRPRRAAQDVTPYVTAEDRSAFVARPGVVTLEAGVLLQVYRTGIDRFAVDLPPGFVVRQAVVEGVDATSVQRGDRLEVSLGAPRTGQLVLRLRAELATGSSDAGEAIALRPLGFPSADRVSGLLGVAQGEGAVVRFERVDGLEQADLGELGGAPAGGDTALRVYRRGGAGGAFELHVAPLAPKVELELKAALVLREREARLVGGWRFTVAEGRVFAVEATLPEGWTLQGTPSVRDAAGRTPPHQLKLGRREVTVELPRGLSRGESVLVSLAAEREALEPLGGAFALPRLSGAPATRTTGLLGVAADEAFTLGGGDLERLVAIPAEELPRAGVDAPGLVLGYRIEGPDYAGRVTLRPRETRVSADLLTRHRVTERVVDTDVRLALAIEGAPAPHVDLLLPAGLGRVARIDGPEVKDDRERLADAPDGRETWRVSFDRPQAGLITLAVRFSTTLPLAGADGTLEAALPRVGLAGAFRERGLVSVASADATELAPRPSGLRAVEVTEVPTDAAPGAGGADQAGADRPLFAYRHAGADYGLGLTIRQHPAADVLSALCRHLELASTVGADGRARHTATFQVRRLQTQFFALRLPQGARLWSVVVNGQGVKPAERDGLQIVPMPAPEAGRQDEEVVVTYTLDGQAWGALGRADLAAPELLVGREAVVPILRTRWTLALPDDYRVVEVEGNLQGAHAPAARPLVPQLWRALVDRGAGALALALLALAVAASARARSGLVGLLALLAGAGEGARRGARDAARGLFASRSARWLGLGLVLAVVCLACLIPNLVQSRKGGGDRYFEVARTAAPYAPGADLAQSAPVGKAVHSAGSLSREGDKDGDGAADYSTADELMELEGATLGLRSEGRGKEEAAERKLAEALAEREVRLPAAPPAPPSAAPPMPAPPMPAPRPARPSRGRAQADQKPATASGLAEDRYGAEEDMPMPAPAEPMPEPEPAPEESLRAGRQAAGPRQNARPPRRRDAQGPAGGAGGGLAFGAGGGEGGDKGDTAGAPKDEAFDDADGEAPAGAEEPPAPAVAEDPNAPMSQGLAESKDAGASTRTEPEALRHVAQADPGELGQVGLRSLVLALPTIGQQAVWERPGGGAVLQVGLVRQASLVGASLALALAALVLGLVLPARFGLSITGVLVVGLVVVTALPAAGLDARWTPLLNALAGGLLLAAPVHAATALGRAWAGRPLARLAAAVAARRAAGGPTPGRAAGVARAALFALVTGAALAPAPALAQGAPRPTPPQPAPRPAGQAPGQPDERRVYVPYDPAKPDAPAGRVFVPEDLYLDLWRRAFPDRTPTAPAGPIAPAVVTDVEYRGETDGRRLTLQARVEVDVLAEGWQRVSLGLQGAGLEGVKVEGPRTDARVVVAPAGGFDLTAQGPGRYRVTLDLVAPSTAGGFVFQAVPALAARLELRSTVPGRRVVVGGARAQRERPDAGAGAGGASSAGSVVEAALGDAPRVLIALADRGALLAGGPSEASATTDALVWVRRGRVVLLSQTAFQIAGAGREGFVFEVPAGLEVTSVEADGLRDWRVVPGDGGAQGARRLEVTLRRATGARAQVTVWGEQQVTDTSPRLVAPQVVAQGVSRDAGTLGVAVEAGLRVRPVDLGAALRQTDAGPVRGLAQRLRAGDVERAYAFTRRPAVLELERVVEPVEVKADTSVRAVVGPERVDVTVRVQLDVRRGKVYALDLALPEGLALEGAPRGLDVRERHERRGPGGERVLRLGLGTGLAGAARLELDLAGAPAWAPDGSGTCVLPDVRPLDVAWETTQVVVGAAEGLKLRAGGDPAGLTARDAKSAARAWDGAPAQPVDWALAWQRPNGRVPGLGQATLRIARPVSQVTGSWVLHAFVERDVVRYALRALYDIEAAGRDRFALLLPAAVGDRATIEAVNLREVTSEALDTGPDGPPMRRHWIQLQSPASNLFEVAATWEEVLGEGAQVVLPRVGVDGVDRQVRGTVLVEKATDVSDALDEVSRAGAIEVGRAADAPALPPGRRPSDFAFTYRVALKDGQPWGATLRLVPRAVTLPQAARVPWLQLTSVVTTEGFARHRARWRVRNLRLQFLTLALPQGAEVWSLFVAGAPRRPHREGERLLVPLPKRTDADLSFDVELVYATPLDGRFGFGGKLRPVGPALETPEVQVEKTFWTVHVPDGWDVTAGGGNVTETGQAAVQVQVLQEELNELKLLDEVTQRGAISARPDAYGNVVRQQERVASKLDALAKLGDRAVQGELERNRRELEQVQRAVETRRSRDEAEQAEQQKQQAAQTDNVVVEGKNFQRLASGWYSNEEVVGADNRVQWRGLDADKGKKAQGPGQQAGEWTIVVTDPDAPAEQQAQVVLGEYAQGQQEVGRNRNAPASGYAQWGATTPAPTDVTLGRETQGLGAPVAAGALSIEVPFETPGRALLFQSDAQAPATVDLTVYPQGTGRDVERAARGLALLVLLAGVLRLGLLRRLPGKAPLQALCLLAAAGLAALTFAHLAGAAAALAAGAWGLRRGPVA